MSDEIKTCVTCKHCKVFVACPATSQCRRVVRTNLVSGEQEFGSCDVARDAGKPCGPSALYWEKAEVAGTGAEG